MKHDCPAVRRHALYATATSVTLIASATAAPASAQQAYFSVTGDFNTAGDQHDFNFSVLSDIASNPNVFFRTYANAGGTNLAGETIVAGGIDSVLELTDSTASVVGFDDDFPGLGLDSQIAFADSDTPLPDPLPTESYRLNLEEFNNNNVGAWAIDLAVPAAAATLTSVTPAQVSGGASTSTVSSFKFGTNPTGMGTAPATFNQIATLDVVGPLVVANTGDAVLNNTGTTTVTGLTTVNAGGTLDANAGTFNANGGVDLNGGTLNTNGSAFSWGSGQTFDASNNAQINLLGSRITIAANRSVQVRSGSSLMAANGLDIGNGSFGTLLVEGAGSTFNGGTGFSFWGLFGGTANVTFRDQAAGALNETLLLAGFGDNSTGMLAVESGASLDVSDEVFIGARDIDPQPTGLSATVTVTGNGSTFTQTGATSIVLGNANAGSAAVNVTDRGVFTTGTGGTTVNATGTLNVDTAGRFISKNDLTLNPGATVNVTAGVGQASFLTVEGRLDVVPGTTVDVAGGNLIVDELNLGGGAFDARLGGGLLGAVEVNHMTGFDTNPNLPDALFSFGARTPANNGNTSTIDTGSLTARIIGVGTLADAGLVIENGGQAQSTGSSTIGSNLINTTGNLTVTGSGSLFDANAIAVNRGTVDVNDGGEVLTSFGVTVGANGTLRGNGTVNVGTTVTNEGIVTPDSISQGSITTDLLVSGDYTQTADGRLRIGTATGTDVLDALEVTGAVALAGNVDFITADYSIIPLYSPDTDIDVLIYSNTSLAGVFDTVTGHVQSDGTALAVYYDSEVRFQRVLYGDGNRNGQVEQGDLDAVLQNWGRSNLGASNDDVSWVTGDYNGNGTVEQGDLDAVLQNWGNINNAPDFSGFTVPEPATLVGLLPLLCARRRASAR